MSFFASLNVRLPAITVGLALVSSAVMGGLSWSSARGGLAEAAQERLQFAASSRKTGIELVGERVAGDFGTVAANPQVAGNFGDLVEALDPAKADFTQIVRAYTDGATLEARLGAEATGTMYGRRHAKVQEVARKLLERPGYADLIFVSDDGRIVYTTTKGADFGQRLSEPDLGKTGLVRLVERLKAAPGEAMLFEDYAAYPVDAGPSAFLGRAVTRRANVAMGTGQDAARVGFVVMRLTPALFDRTLTDRSGLGQTGQILAIGADGLLRSNPPLSGAVRAGRPVADLGLDRNELAGGQPFTYAPETGRRMVASAKVSVLGTPWTLLAEQGEDEMLASVGTLTGPSR